MYTYKITHTYIHTDIHIHTHIYTHKQPYVYTIVRTSAIIGTTKVLPNIEEKRYAVGSSVKGRYEKRIPLFRVC